MQCVTFKQNKKDFNIYTRKYRHDFKLTTNNSNYEGACSLFIPTNNVFLVSNIDNIQTFNAIDYSEVDKNLMEVKLMPTEERERNEVISMAICPYERYIAVITGKNLIKNEQKAN